VKFFRASANEWRWTQTERSCQDDFHKAPLNELGLVRLTREDLARESREALLRALPLKQAAPQRRQSSNFTRRLMRL